MDGITIKVPKNKRQLLLEKLAHFQAYIVDIDYEIVEYKKCFLYDVNNYIIEKTDGTLKLKGRFDINSTDLNKNKSLKIIPKAVINKLVYNIEVDETLEKENSIFDYCIGNRIKDKNYQFEELSIDKDEKSLSYIKRNKLDSVIRYYVAKKGFVIVKQETNGKKVSFLVAHPQKGRSYKLQKIEEIKEWTENKEYHINNIDKGFYKHQIEKELLKIEQFYKQNLFD